MSVNKPSSQEQIQKLRESYGKDKAQRQMEYGKSYNHIELAALRKHVEDKSISPKHVNKMNERHEKEYNDKETSMNIRMGWAVHDNVQEKQSIQDARERQSLLDSQAKELLKLRDSKYSSARHFDVASSPPPANKDGMSFEK